MTDCQYRTDPKYKPGQNRYHKYLQPECMKLKYPNKKQKNKKFQLSMQSISC